MDDISASMSFPQDKPEMEHLSPHCAAQDIMPDEVNLEVDPKREASEKEQVPHAALSNAEGDSMKVF